MREIDRDVELRRLTRAKQANRAPLRPLGPELVSFFKQSGAKRQTKFAPVAACWDALVPETLRDHAALESFSRGTLTVVVDSSSHLYELKQLLLSGLEKQIVAACKSTGLRKVSLKPGRWYQGGGSTGEARRDQRWTF